MTERDILKRKIKLKRQAISIINAEVQRLRLEAALLEVRHFLERQIDRTENQKALSQNIDMVEGLLQAIREEWQ